VEDRLSRLEGRVEQLSRALSDLDRRIRDVEGRIEVEARGAPVVSARSAWVERAGLEPPAPVESDLGVALSLIGRTLLALGGAYLLRAITEAGALPEAVGVTLGLGYACAWIFLADRAGAAGKTASAAFHAGAATLVGYAIIWESTVRLGLLAPLASASLVLAFSLVLTTVVWRFRLASTAWVAQVAVVVTAFALMGGTRAVLPYAAVLVVVGVVTLWLGYRRGWPPLQWFAAAAADVAVLLVTLGALAQPDTVPAGAALSVQVLLFLSYFLSFYRRSLEGVDSAIGTFEIVQSVAAVVVGLGGTLAVADTPLARGLTGGVGILAAIVAQRRASLESEPEPGRIGALFSGLAVACLLLATSTTIPAPSLLWTVLGTAGFVLAKRKGRLVLGLQGGALILASGVASGLFYRAAYVLAAPASFSWPRFSALDLVVVAIAAAACATSVAPAPSRGALRRVPGALALATAVAGGATAVLYVLGPLVAGVPGGVVDPAALASLRTAVLSLAAMGLGALAGRIGLREASWLLYPLLVLTSIKLILEDFPNGNAGTLFAALALYGCALIVAPRLSRRSQ
jgi:hypothetical protein